MSPLRNVPTARPPRRGPSRTARTRGGALIISLLAMTVMFLLFTALTSTRVLELESAVGNRSNTYAQQIAEAGVHHIIGLIARDEGALPGTTPLYSVERDFSDGSFTARAELVAGTEQVRIVSTGVESDGVARTVEILMSYERNHRLLKDHAMTMCGNVTLEGSSQVNDGDLYVGGNLAVKNENAIVNGDALAYGAVSFDGKAKVGGNVISETGDIYLANGNSTTNRVGGNATNRADRATLSAIQVAGVVSNDPNVYDMPDYCQGDLLTKQTRVSDEDLTNYKTEAMADSTYLGSAQVKTSGTGGYNGQRYISGDLTIEGTPAGFEFSGTYFVEGNLTITGSYSGNATFVVMGSTLLKGNMTVGQTGEVRNAVIGKGNVSMEGGMIYNGVVYSNGVVSGSGGAIVNGSVVGVGENSEDGNALSGSLTVNYKPPGEDLDLPNEELLDFAIDRWRLLSS